MNRVVIYQVLPRLLGNQNVTRHEGGSITENGTGKFHDIDTKTLRRIHSLGATHVWYTGIIRHATTTDYTQYGIPRQHPSVVKGQAGSPYAIADYYDIDPDLATRPAHRMEEFECLVERTHREGLKVVIDFVPNHVARQYHSVCRPQGVEDIGERDNTSLHFSPTNDFYYCVDAPFVPPCGGDYSEVPARATGNDCFSPCPSTNDWYETIKLNYGIDYNDWSGTPSTHFSPIPPLWLKMVNILHFWASHGVDAFRCDMAEMVPTSFWTYAIEKVKESYPNMVFIGEVYNPREYHDYLASGFDYLYDKVGMYDTLRACILGTAPTSDITSRWQETDDIRSHMLYFMENHDEQRIASDYFAGDARRGLPAMVVCALLSTNPIMVYAGQEYGEKGMDSEGFSHLDGRTTIFDYWSIDSLIHGYYKRSLLTREEKSIEAQYKTLLHIAHSQESITSGASFDLMYVNPHLRDGQYAFLRGRDMLIVVNFRHFSLSRTITIPAHAFDFLGISQGNFLATDLLTDQQLPITLQKDGIVPLTIPSFGAVVLKW